jgi:hypothetical protein
VVGLDPKGVVEVNAPVPDEIGPYRVLRPIARGGMAEVYEVEDRTSGEHLALKLLVQTGGALPRFNREYEAMIRLNHPNIVRVYAYGFLGNLPWLSMELVDGTPVQAYAKRWGKPGTLERTQEIVRVAHDLALALDHIHRRGLVHRDLKSANVLVLPDGRVKLLDFGTARVSDAAEDITREGEFIGTFAYASPEQLLNTGLDGRSDLYSLGVLLYRLATGRRPFESDDPGELARQHVKVEPPPPSTWAEVPPGLERLIMALLAKNPDHRPQTGAELADALQRLAGSTLYAPKSLEIDLAHDRLVGREEQLRALWRFLEGRPDEEAQGRTTDMALVVGQQGSGRHQIMQWLEQDVIDRGWRPFTVFFRKGSEDLDQFTAMLLQVARSFATGEPTPPVVADAVEAIRLTERSTSVSIAERLAVLRLAGADLLRGRASQDEGPVVIFVRGLQYAGAVGYEALVGIREQLQATPGLVLFIADCLENADDPSSPARKRLPDAIRIQLPPMNARQVALLVGGLLHRRPPPAQIAKRIHNASGGLPTYVDEVVKGLLGRGILRARGPDQNRIEWAQQDDIDIPVPLGARERLTLELATLPADRRRCLEALVLCGGEATIRVLAAALQCTTGELVPALEDLDRRGWITLTRRNRQPYAKWRQVLADAVVLDQIHPCRRRVLERLLIEQVADDPAFVAQIQLLLGVGKLEFAVLRARDWAVHHLSKHRAVTALQVLDLVVSKLEDDTTIDDQIKAELFLMHATCLLYARPTDPRTSRSLARAKKLAATGDLFEAEVLYIKALVQQTIGHYPNFRKHLTEAWYIVENVDPMPLTATIATLLGWSARMDGQVDEAAAWYGRSRRIALKSGAPIAQAHADVGVAGWQLARGLLGEAERTVGAALRVLAEHEDQRGLSQGMPIWAEALTFQGRFTEVFRMLYEQAPTMRESEMPTLYVRHLLAVAAAEIHIGRLGRAQECVDELGATIRKGEHLELRLQADLVWGRIQVASGLYTDAAAKLSDVKERATAAGLRGIASSAEALHGEASWALGDMKGALQRFRSAVQALQHTGDLPALAQAVMAQARAMCESVDPDLVFRPLIEWLEQQPALIVRIERHIARGRYLKAMGKPHETTFDEAQHMIEELAMHLDPTDAAALRLHPWTQWIRRARKGQRR